MSTDQSYILVPRQYRDHPLFPEPDKLGAWLWIMLAAAHTARDVPGVNGGEPVHLEPGQLTFSIRFLVKKWGWSDGKVQRFLDGLVREGFVTTDTTTGQTVITICNWEEIQRRNLSATTAATTGSTTATTTKKKQLKQLKKNTLSAEGFEEWYAAYPKHVDRIDAERAYAKVIASGSVTHADLMAAVARYAAKVAGYEKKYIKGPAVWLNKGSYLDEPDATAPAAPPLALPETDAEWQRCLKVFHATQQWAGNWGPRPGMLGCLVPSHLVVAPVTEGSLRGTAVARPVRSEALGIP